jgi:hypothetical protein
MIRIFTNLLADLGDHEFSKRLSVAIGAAVMLLWLHFINNNLGALQVFHNLSFNSDSLKVRLANMELAIGFQSQDATEVNLASFGGLR